MDVSDNEIMFQVKQGDIKKIELLYNRYSNQLFAYFFKLTGLRSISEDFVNDTFYKIITHSKKYRGEGIFSVWMYRIAYSIFADNYKKLKYFVLSEDNLKQENIESMDNPAERESKETQKQSVHKALLQLKPKERQVLVLSNFDGLKYKEIASILNCSEGAVKVKVHRALQKLRTIYFNHQN